MRARQEEVCQRESRKRRGREGRVGCAARAVGAAPRARGVGGVGSGGVRARAGGPHLQPHLALDHVACAT